MLKNCSVCDMRILGIGLLLVVFVSCRGLLEDEACPRKHHALLIALLPLHEGDDCMKLVQKGVQQKIALETTLEIINNENDLLIGLKIFDTCSNWKRAVESAEKAVAFAGKRCSKLPLFLGLLGPDDEVSLNAVLGIHEYPHVIPAASSFFRLFNGINVELVDVDEKARRVIKLLNYLNWYSFILIFTSDGVSSRIAMSLLESDQFCLTNSVLRIPSFGSGLRDRTAINRLRRAVEDLNDVRIVVITDDASVMGYFADYVEDNWGDFEYVVYAEKSGVLPWKGSEKLSQHMIIVQETPRSPLLVDDFESIIYNSSYWRELSRIDLCEECRSFKPRPDPTVVPYVYSLHLFSRALKTATRKKCGRSLICDGLRTMPPAEWRDILEETVTVVGDSKLRFYMQLESAVEIFARGDAGFEVVGVIEEEVGLYRSDALNRSGRSKIKQCMVDMYQFELETEATVTTTAKPEETTEATAEEQRVPLNFGYYELMATVIGFPIGLVLLIGLTVACVYRSFRSGSELPGKFHLSADPCQDDYS